MRFIVFPSDETADDRARARRRELAAFFAVVPADSVMGDRTDRRRGRWVLCGEHGYVRNHVESCPNCGGYAEPKKNVVMARRLARRKNATRRLMKSLAAKRRAKKLPA